MGSQATVRTWLETPFLATRVLVGACVLVFGLIAVDHGGIPVALLRGRGLLPSEILRFGGLFGEAGTEEPWRLLSACYIHLGVLHLGMNMMALIALGKRAEERVGPARMIVAFTVTGICGFLASEWWYAPFSPPTAGASGALFGLMGHEIGQMHGRNDPRVKDVFFQFAAYAVAFALLAWSSPVGLNNAAHVGGFLAGYPLGRLFHLERRPWRRKVLAQAGALICLVAAGASVYLSDVSDLWRQVRSEEIQRGFR